VPGLPGKSGLLHLYCTGLGRFWLALDQFQGTAAGSVEIKRDSTRVKARRSGCEHSVSRQLAVAQVADRE
jgi:hypothetical protein